MDLIRAYRTFYKDSKLNVVKLVLEGARSMNKIAEEFGVSVMTLNR